MRQALDKGIFHEISLSKDSDSRAPHLELPHDTSSHGSGRKWGPGIEHHPLSQTSQAVSASCLEVFK